MTHPLLLSHIAELRQRIHALRAHSQTIALIPTMGALHDGHLELVRAAGRSYSRTIATVFVNPKQFAQGEDYARYPRTMVEDLRLLATVGVDCVFTPSEEEMYPRGFATEVRVAGLSDQLCGPLRPGHFTGVATIVTKLLLQALPDGAFFGDKDFQQLQIVRRLTHDLNIPVAVHGIPTVRDADGLALSSRNRYLSARERRIAPLLPRLLSDLAAHIGDCAPSPERLKEELKEGEKALLAAGFSKVDYLSVNFEDDLRPAWQQESGRHRRVFAAAYLGQARLIDNWPVAADVEVGKGSTSA